MNKYIILFAFFLVCLSTSVQTKDDPVLEVVNTEESDVHPQNTDIPAVIDDHFSPAEMNRAIEKSVTIMIANEKFAKVRQAFLDEIKKTFLETRDKDMQEIRPMLMEKLKENIRYKNARICDDKYNARHQDSNYYLDLFRESLGDKFAVGSEFYYGSMWCIKITWE